MAECLHSREEFAKLGNKNCTFQTTEFREQKTSCISQNLVYRLLQGYAKQKDLAGARHVQYLMACTGIGSVPFLTDHLIRLFASCQCSFDANQAFLKVSTPSEYTWSAIISANAKLGKGEAALDLYTRMQRSGVKHDRYVYTAVLSACAVTSELLQGRLIHGQIIGGELESDVVIGNTLVDMYAKCGSVEEAQKLFDRLQIRDVVSWGAIIAGYVQHGYGLPALELFEKMYDGGIKPEKETFSVVLKACSMVGAIGHGRLIHNQLIKNGIELNVVLGNVLIHMYAKCGSLEEASRLFDRLLNPDHVSWGTMIAAHAQSGHSLQALELLRNMEQYSLKPDKLTFSSSLKACGELGAKEEGRLIHEQSLESGFEWDVVLGNILVDMYAKCGSLEEAYRMFDKLQIRDLVSWGAIIMAYAQYGHGLSALELSVIMQQQGINADKVTFLGTLKACGSIRAIEEGRLIHSGVIKTGDLSDVVVNNTIIDMYMKCGSLMEAQNIFENLPHRDGVSWGVMIAGYAQQGFSLLAFSLFENMQQDNLKPDHVTFLSILRACSNVGIVNQGRLIHEKILRAGLQKDIVIGNALIDMYIKCGSLDEANAVFEIISNPDVISWGAIIEGHIQHEYVVLALELFDRMIGAAVEPNELTFLSVLKACGLVGAIERGRLIHDYIVKHGLVLDMVIGSTIIDMYANCGSLEEAYEVFKRLPNQDVISCGAMIAACAQCGNSSLAQQCLEDMHQNGINPDGVVFISILSACSHSYLVDEGCHYFESMQDFGIRANTPHHISLVDLLSRAGYLFEAEDFLHSIQSHAVGWMSLLTACRTYMELELGRRCLDHIIELDSRNPAGYILMASIYADVHE